MVDGRIGRDVRLKLNGRKFGVRDDSETGGIGGGRTEKIGTQKNEPGKKNDAIEERGSKTKDTGTTGREWKNDERRKSLYVADVEKNVTRLGEWNLKRLGGQGTWHQGTQKGRNKKETRKKEK